MTQRVFVAGATGFVGKALVAEARRQGAQVWAHVRPDSKQLQQWQAFFDDLGADVSTAAWQPEAMAAELRRLAPTLIFCCIGTTAKRMGQDGKAANSYEAIDFGLTKLLADAAQQAGGIERLTYVSSLGAGPNAAGQYLQWRYRAEQAVQACSVPWTIARPSFITGSRDESRPAEHYGAIVVDALLKGLGVLGATSTRDRYRSTNDVILARALWRIALQPEAAGQVILSGDLRK